MRSGVLNSRCFAVLAVRGVESSGIQGCLAIKIAKKELSDGDQESGFATVWQGTFRMVHGNGADRSTISSSRSGARARRERNLRAGRTHGMAHASTWPDAHRYGGMRLGAAPWRTSRGDPARGCRLVRAGRKTLAWSHRHDRYDTHCHSGKTRRQSGRLDGACQRRAVPRSSVGQLRILSAAC